ncbi:unnamed protein product [Callosobruchus maculatus]|uniref:C2H2-type domain-containing protein n=1 Tax=Callosobruchus maculatus TaxID=64391 RepID=A0A653D9T4_CALMS|nr:unnamed protein product [Callosobruchus maculatus]
MDLDSQIMKIKQEKYDEKDIHNEDYIVKLESEHLIEINSHGIKTEINNQEEIDSTTSAFEFVGTESSNEESQFQDTKIKIKREYPDTYTGQLTEKLGSSSSNDTSEHATVYSAWHRIKEEPTTDSWSEVKTEEVDVTEVEVKCEKPESKLTSQQLEDMDSLQLSKLLDIETKVDPTIFSADSAIPRKTQTIDLTGPEGNLFVCYTCNYKASSKCGLISHTNRNKCNLKNSVDKSLARSLAHRRQNMSNEYMCMQCKVTYKKKASLDNHIIKNHTEYIASVSYRVHQCRNCDYRTTHKSSFRRHMQVHPRALRYEV